MTQQINKSLSFTNLCPWACGGRRSLVLPCCPSGHTALTGLPLQSLQAGSAVKTPLRRACLSFAFQMVQNFQDESCFMLSTLKGKPLPAFLVEVWSVLPVVRGWRVAGDICLGRVSPQDAELGAASGSKKSPSFLILSPGHDRMRGISREACAFVLRGHGTGAFIDGLWEPKQGLQWQAE